MQLDAVVFGHRLRHYRRVAGLTLEELGTRVGRPAPHLSLLENGKREPRLSQIAELAAALGVEVAELLSPEPPNRRARLEMALEKAQRHPRFSALGLPHLKPTARLPDEAIEHVVRLFEELIADPHAGPGSPAELRAANGDVTRELAEANGHLRSIEELATATLRACDYSGWGPLTSRHLTDIAASFGYRVRSVDDIPIGLRSVTDLRSRTIFVAQRNELRTRQARKAILQTLGSIALAHGEPATTAELLRQRLETAYFATAVLMPEVAAVGFLGVAKADRDLSVEDLKEQFYVSYEMAAQRFTNLATTHLDLATHFIRSDEAGTVWKGYQNDGFPIPTDGAGGMEGQTLCREVGARAAFASEEKFDIHHQFTDTPAGSFWSSTHIAPDLSGHAFSVGVRFEDARWFRGRATAHHRRSGCPDGDCCRRPTAELAARWANQVEAHARFRDRLVGLLTPDIRGAADLAELYRFAERHAESGPGTPSGPGYVEYPEGRARRHE